LQPVIHPGTKSIELSGFILTGPPVMIFLMYIFFINKPFVDKAAFKSVLPVIFKIRN